MYLCVLYVYIKHTLTHTHTNICLKSRVSLNCSGFAAVSSTILIFLGRCNSVPIKDFVFDHFFFLNGNSNVTSCYFFSLNELISLASSGVLTAFKHSEIHASGTLAFSFSLG